MLRPSYAELMDILNKEGEGANVKSRYTIVIAAAKRARQLIDGHAPMIAEEDIPVDKALSIAIEEMREGKIEIVPEGQGTNLVLKKPEPVEEEKEETTDFDSEDDADEDFDGENEDGEFDDEEDADLLESLVSGLFDADAEEKEDTQE